MDGDGWTTFEHIFRDLLYFVVAMTALLIALVVIVSFLPEGNPLKRIFSALSYRVGATAALGALALPLEPIPGIGELYDIGAPAVLIWFWYTFFRDLRGGKPVSATAPMTATLPWWRRLGRR